MMPRMGTTGAATAQEELAKRAEGFDLDACEARALDAARRVPGFSSMAEEFAWLPLAVVGVGARWTATRKLRRAALARALERAWISELSWEEGEEAKEALRAGADAMGEACSWARVSQLVPWAAMELGGPPWDPRWGGLGAALAASGSAAKARVGLFPALDRLGVDEGEEGEAAGMALALMDRAELSASCGEGGEGRSGGGRL